MSKETEDSKTKSLVAQQNERIEELELTLIRIESSLTKAIKNVQMAIRLITQDGSHSERNSYNLKAIGHLMGSVQYLDYHTPEKLTITDDDIIF